MTPTHAPIPPATKESSPHERATAFIDRQVHRGAVRAFTVVRHVDDPGFHVVDAVQRLRAAGFTRGRRQWWHPPGAVASAP